MLRKLLCVLPLGLLLASQIHGQDQRKVTFRTLCLDQAPGLEKVYVATGNDPSANQEVILYLDLSPDLEASFAATEAIFYRLNPGPDGKPMRVPVGRGPLAKSNRQLIVFGPKEPGEGKLPYTVRCFDDDISAFPMGTVRAINFAPVPVRFMVSGTVTPPVPPSKHAHFPQSTKVDEFNMYAVVVEFQSATGQWVKGQSGSWKATNLRRDVVVTMVDPKFRQPDVRTFADAPPWLQKAPPKGP